MRILLAALALVSMTACNSGNSADLDRDQQEAAPVSFFDGADYGTDDAAMLAHGERLSNILMCTGCHDSDMTGKNWGDNEAEFEGLWASNLTHALPQLTDEELLRLLIEGVHPERGDMYVMPAKLYQHVPESDLKALIAYLRTLEPIGEASPPPQFLPETQAAIDAGEINTSVEDVAVHAANLPLDHGAAHERGRQLAMVTCAECHGPALDGEHGFAPNLDMAGIYDRDQLTQLLTTGEGANGRKLQLMARVASAEFVHFTPDERDAVVDYVLARAEANTAP